MGGREASGRIGLLGLALGMGVAVVAAENILFSLLTGRPLGFAADVEPITVAIVAAPFLILALLGAVARAVAGRIRHDPASVGLCAVRRRSLPMAP